ncbi:hypothetical protein ACQP2E_11775 [Actinoplanes sp. CA-015351]|uniref:hypothetical protein n=1 Tax=Actinoplanes sp. CA-015351 TaxID=3239897 RepID=UPI003D98DBD2
MSRKRLIVVVVVAVALAAGLGAWWARPRVAEGSLIGAGDGMTWANDGVEDTRMLVRGRQTGPVTATFSIRNDGRLPFSVEGLDVSDEGDWLAQQTVTFVAGLPGDDPTVKPVDRITLGRGEEATVNWSMDMSSAESLGEGDIVEIDALRFRLSWLGLPRTGELLLDQPITFVGPI